MSPTRNNRNGYTLIEAVVASAILLIGISAAASMSLAMVTREEINERSEKTYNHIDNCVRLLQLGLDPAEVVQVLPPCDTLVNLDIQAQPINVAGLGPRQRWWVRFEWNTTAAKSTSGIGKWVGGEQNRTRTEAFYVYRSDHFLDQDLARVQWSKATP